MKKIYKNIAQRLLLRLSKKQRQKYDDELSSFGNRLFGGLNITKITASKIDSSFIMVDRLKGKNERQ